MMDRFRRLALTTAACSLLIPATSAFANPPVPKSVIAVLDVTQNFGSTRRAVSFYDATAIGQGTAGAAEFNQTPMFSIWTGYEDSFASNFEDPGAITVNPVNGDVYVVAFDSGSAPTIDFNANDTDGDYDLYKLDYQAVLKDYIDNARPAGTMYAPTIAPDGPAFGTMQDHPDHPGSTVFLPTASTKIGELGRTEDGPFFDYDIEFVDPATMVFSDNQNGADNINDDPAFDHELRLWERVDTAPGTATSSESPAGSWEGGFNNGTSQSWEADRLALVNQDFDMGGSPIGRSEPGDIALVNRDGVLGVWLAEADGGNSGDDLVFFEIDRSGADAFATKSTIEGTGTSRAIDNDPEFDPQTNDGNIDFIKVDADGNVIIGESNFFETPTNRDPTVLRLNIDQYQTGNVDTSGMNPGGDQWDDLSVGDGLGPKGSDAVGDFTSAPVTLDSLPGFTLDDDGDVTDGRFTTYDPATNQLYVFDTDGGPGDVYVIDLDTGAVVYEELDATNHFLEQHGIRFFTRGDTDGDGDVDADDIDAFGTTANGMDDLQKEMFDLTSDFLLVYGYDSGSDSDELIREVLGTEYGDANLDGMVDGTDVSTVAATLNGSLGTPGGWAAGDYNGDGVVDFLDVSILATEHGFTNMPAPIVVVPEPATLALLGLGGLIAMRRRR